MNTAALTRGALAVYLALFFAFLFGPLLVMGVSAFNTPSYPQAWPIEGFTFAYFRDPDGTPLEIINRTHYSGKNT